MLTTLTEIPEGLLNCEAHELYRVLSGPTLIHLPGRREAPLFVSVLLHGNEDTGWHSIRAILHRYSERELPRSLSIFIGNVAAARYGQRFLEGQPDYNRIWEEDNTHSGTDEHRMMAQIVDDMKSRQVFAAIDVHNNSGINPHYACVRKLENVHLHLATLFSRTVVYFRTPKGVQIAPFSKICPSTTLEAGQVGQKQGTEHTVEYIDACLHLLQIPDHPVVLSDIDLFHTVAVCKIPQDVSFGFGTCAGNKMSSKGQCDIEFVEDLDHMNFRELPTGTTLGWVRRQGDIRLDVRDEDGRNVEHRFFHIADGELRTLLPFMPSMLSLNHTAIRQDCLCYLMERYPGP